MDSPAAMMFLIVVIVLAFIVLGALLGSFFTINTAERGVVERFNKFSRIAGPGLSLKLPFAETVHRVDMRVQELPFKIETKTKDNVFVVIPVSVQYQVLADKVSDAYYKLTDPQKQIESYVYNVILGHVPKSGARRGLPRKGSDRQGRQGRTRRDHGKLRILHRARIGHGHRA